jgi:16S rRNA G966 N2-methylase RsmD
MLKFLQDQREINNTTLTYLKSQELTINNIVSMIVVQQSQIDKLIALNIDVKQEQTETINVKWLPIILYGKITESDKEYIYTFSKKIKKFPFSSFGLKNNAYQNAIDEQIKVSLENGRNNRYYIENNIVNLELRDGSITKCDIDDFKLISDKVWYPEKGYAISRINDKKIKMANVIIGEGNILYNNGNILDNRRSNISTVNSKIPDIIIPNDVWNQLKVVAKHSDEKFDEVMNYILYNIKDIKTFPHIKYNLIDIQDDYLRLFNSSNVSLVTCGIGGKISNYFMKDALFSASKKGFKTVEEVWSDDTSKIRLLKGMINFDMDAFTPKNLTKSFALNFYKVGNFPALAAKNIYDHYLFQHITGKDLRVLDFCSGYGGRLMGFWASKYSSHYVGIDPNTKLIGLYKEMVSWLRTQQTHCKKYVTMVSNCAELVEYENIKYEDGSLVKDNLFDIVFTSPPYFDLEIYSKEETQSCIKYPNLDNWKNNFLFATLNKVTKVLKNKGVLAINIKDSKKWHISICDEMKTYIISLGFTFVETQKLILSKRPNSKKESFEPIYIFIKQ